MLRFIRRGAETAQPIGDLPAWLSGLLRTRGIDTPEKAERFLHPDLSHLHDPFAMQDMDKAVRLITRAVADHASIMIYGDYDVDGVCATSILLETLREMGAAVDFYIPDRHSEGYGLNCDAIRHIAETHQLLLTVDCGVTNHEEVKLAQLLGMTVIVSDHHQLAETASPADATLNPLLGTYPFRRLCGAGVALKICQALQGMEGVQKRLELAALATVADIVPLIDENRVIVKLGMEAMAMTPRVGLRALMDVAGVAAPVNAGQIGFRLAPRLNAGGRLADAAQGVLLLTTQDADEAARLAATLEERNRTRQELEKDITDQALAAIATDVDFRDDGAIILMGEKWNSGVIGLAAGRICEKYHWPTIVLSRDGDTAVGSCRSIPGVNIHAMLTTCKDLFLRFGGHEQAAGLTMKAELVPELRRRLSLAIREHCDPLCYLPAKEYDLPISLQQADLAFIDALEALQPTGFGNPSPVFLCAGASVQQARRVGSDGQHLKLQLLDGVTVRDGIAFSMGAEADRGLTTVDVLFVPEKNVWRDKVSAQMKVKALRPASGASPLPSADANFAALLQELCVLAANKYKLSDGSERRYETLSAVKKLSENGCGTLYLTHSADTARLFAAECAVDTAEGAVTDARAFNTLLCAPNVTELADCWHDVVLLDGDAVTGEAALIREQCPRAALHVCKPSEALTKLLADISLNDEALREIYKALRRNPNWTPEKLCEAAERTKPQVLTALTAFAQVGLVKLCLAPFACVLNLRVKCAMTDSELIRYLRANYGETV